MNFLWKKNKTRNLLIQITCLILICTFALPHIAFGADYVLTTGADGHKYINNDQVNDPERINSGASYYDYYTGASGQHYLVNPQGIGSNGAPVPITDEQYQTALQFKADNPLFNPTPSNNQCTLDYGKGIICFAAYFLSYIVLGISSFLLWLSGILLNFILGLTVIHLKDTLSNIKAVDIGWKAFRDLANMFFIFILLYIAIATILQISSINTKKTLATLIIVALLINFSMFFTKVVIDAGNLFALTFYNKITVNHQPIDSDISDGDSGNTLADAFITPLKLETLYGNPKSGEPTAHNVGVVNNTNYASIALISIFGSMLMLIAAFIFLTACVLFVTRFVTLLFLILLSPLAFAGMILPQTKSKISDKWWSALFNQSFFPLIFFMIIWVVVQVISDTSWLGDTGNMSFTSLFSADGSGKAVALLLNFVIVSALLIASLVISKTMAMTGGTAVQTLVKSGTNRLNGALRGTGRLAASPFVLAGKGAKYGAGVLARETIGRRAKELETTFKTSPFANTLIGDKIRDLTTRKVQEAKFGTTKGYVQSEKDEKDRISRKTDSSKIQALTNYLGELGSFRNGPPPLPNEKEAKAAQLRGIQANIAQQLLQLSSVNALPKSLLLNKEIAPLLSSNQFVEAVKGKDLVEKEKDDLIKSRFDYLKPIHDNPNMTVGDISASGARGPIRGSSIGELELINKVYPDLFSHQGFVRTLNDGGYDALRGSQALTRFQRDDVRDKRFADITGAAQGFGMKFVNGQLVGNAPDAAATATAVKKIADFMGGFPAKYMAKIQQKHFYKEEQKLDAIGNVLETTQNYNVALLAALGPDKLRHFADADTSDKEAMVQFNFDAKFAPFRDKKTTEDNIAFFNTKEGRQFAPSVGKYLAQIGAQQNNQGGTARPPNNFGGGSGGLPTVGTI